MNELGIKYNFTTLDNGVQIGNVFGHKKLRKRIYNGQTIFPKNWSKERIKEAGNIVGWDALQNEKSNGYHFKVIDNVKVGVYLKNGKVKTIFPDSNQNGAI